MAITEKQMQIYRYICDYIKKHDYAPTQNEIKSYFNFKSFGSVQRYINYLIEGGLLTNNENARRGLTPVQKQEMPNSFSIPLLGQVAAGNPIEAIEEANESIEVPMQMIKSSHHHFALSVQGDSMIEDGILEGDTVICRQQKIAENNQTIVALVDGETTIKRFKKHPSHIELIPSNSNFKPIIVHPEQNFSILGILVGLLRLI